MLQDLIHKARRRLLFNEVLKQFALSAALAVGGLALLLTFGTRYVEWWVVTIFTIGVLVWAAAKLRRKLPSDYAAAVWLDDKAKLHDSLSTAHYFARSRSKSILSPEAEAILLAQRGQAETVAGGVDVEIAVPFRFPKALYGLAALLLVSTGMVGVRYFYGHELNLSAPITEVIFQDLAANQQKKAGKPAKLPEKQPDYDEARSLLSKLGLGANLEDKPDDKLDEALADALRSPEKTEGSSQDAKPDQNGNQGDPLDSPKETPKSNGAQAGDNSNKKSSDQSDSPSGQGGAKGDKSEKSLLSKLKDAMDDMMGAPSPSNDKKSAGGKQQQSKPSSQAQAGQQPGEAGDDENKQAADGEANGNAQKGNSPGQTSGNTGNQQEGPSVAGSEDGQKAVKAANQMKAMGKISELIGKRSEQVTGESMIEVQSGNQKLQTAYKDKSAAHGEGSGEVSRDEIPLAVQAYVQEYFQQVRKPEGSTPVKTKKPVEPKTGPASK